jgi:hypothetical protein
MNELYAGKDCVAEARATRMIGAGGLLLPLGVRMVTEAWECEWSSAE